VVLSMTLTPLAIIALRKLSPKIALSLEGVDEPNGLSGSVLLIGFGRFGQVVSQSLLARGVEVSIIDTDVEMIESAQTFGFKVYYGDGTRLDVLHASGADSAQLIAICIDDRAAATVTAQLIKHEFPQARLLARSFDREHALDLVHAGVDLQVRETFESAMRFGEAALVELGVPVDEAAEVVADIRRRDAERFELELVGGVRAGTSLLYGNMQQTPLIAPKPRPSRRGHEEEHAPGISA